MFEDRKPVGDDASLMLASWIRSQRLSGKMDHEPTRIDRCDLSVCNRL